MLVSEGFSFKQQGSAMYRRQLLSSVNFQDNKAVNCEGLIAQWVVQYCQAHIAFGRSSYAAWHHTVNSVLTSILVYLMLRKSSSNKFSSLQSNMQATLSAYLNSTSFQSVIGMHPAPFPSTEFAEELVKAVERKAKSGESFVAKSVHPPPSVYISQYAMYALPV